MNIEEYLIEEIKVNREKGKEEKAKAKIEKLFLQMLQKDVRSFIVKNNKKGKK